MLIALEKRLLSFSQRHSKLFIPAWKSSVLLSDPSCLGKGLCPLASPKHKAKQSPLCRHHAGMDPSSGADLSFLLSQQLNKTPQQLSELFAVLSTVFPSFPPTTTTKPPTTSHPSKAEPCRNPEPPQQEKHREKSTSKNRNYYKSF